MNDQDSQNPTLLSAFPARSFAEPLASPAASLALSPALSTCLSASCTTK